MKKTTFCALVFTVLCIVLSGCGEHQTEKSPDLNFVFQIANGTLQNAEGAKLEFHDQELSGDMDYTLSYEGTEQSPNTSVIIPYSKQFVLESNDPQIDFVIAADPIGLRVAGQGIEKATVTDNSCALLEGDIRDITVSIPLTQELHIGIGKFTVSGGEGTEVMVETTDVGFRIAGLTGYANLKISSTETDGIVFMHRLNMTDPECEIDLSQFLDGVVRITENGEIKEVKTAP